MSVTMRDIVTFEVSEEVISRAREIRAMRDSQYGNIYDEKSSDMRWVGEIGEIIINDALMLCNPDDTAWLTDDVTNQGDFTFLGLDIDVKTVKRKVPMRTHYKAQITARHANKPIDYLLFTCYEYPKKKLHILGVMGKHEFLRRAEYFGAGAQVHQHYTIREGHEIYAITIKDMMPFRDFIRMARAQALIAA